MTNEDVCAAVMRTDISRAWDARSVVEFATMNGMLTTAAVDQIRVMRSALITGAKKGRFIKLSKRGFFQYGTEKAVRVERFAGVMERVGQPTKVVPLPTAKQFPKYMDFNEKLLRKHCIKMTGHDADYQAIRNSLAEFLCFASGFLGLDELAAGKRLEVATKYRFGSASNGQANHQITTNRWTGEVLAEKYRIWAYAMDLFIDGRFVGFMHGYWLNFLHTMTHELAHFKQYLTGEFQGVSKRVRGTGGPIQKYRARPAERDANISAVEAVRAFQAAKNTPLPAEMWEQWQSLAYEPLKPGNEQYWHGSRRWVLEREMRLLQNPLVRNGIVDMAVQEVQRKLLWEKQAA